MPDQYRHPYPEPEPLDRVLGRLPDGTAVAVHHFPPYWDVCVRRKKNTQGAREYFVTEKYPDADAKPQRISETWATQEPANEFARSCWMAWFGTHVSMPEWPWE